MELSMTPTSSVSQLPHFNVWWIPHGMVNTSQEGGFNNQQWSKGLVMFPTSINTSINTQKMSWVAISHSKCWTINWKSWNKPNRISQLAAKGFPWISVYLDHLCPQLTHPYWAYSFLAWSIRSHAAPHLGQGNDTSSFPLIRPILAAS